MTRIIIHAGMPKTGTSYIQETLGANRNELAKESVLYPISGGYPGFGPCHHKLFLCFATDSDAWPMTPFSKVTATPTQLTNELKSEVAFKECDTVIVSSEMLYEISRDLSVLRSIKENLNFSTIEVLLILRQQADFVESMYAQRVRGVQRYKKSPKSHLSEFVDSGLLDYENQISNLVSVFGEDRIYMCWYHDIKDDLLYPFRYLTNSKLNLRTYPKNINVRPTWATIYARRRLNSIPYKYKNINAFMLSLIKRAERLLAKYGLQNGLEKYFKPFPDVELERINQRYAAENRKIEERFEKSWIKK